MIRTIGFPGQYHQGPGALGAVGEFLNQCGFARPTLICDDFVRQHIIPGIANLPDNLPILTFPGECTTATIDTLCGEAEAADADVIIAVGGGKCIDAAKGVSKRQRVSVIVCPTIASTDAPTSRLIVLYDEQHRVTDVDYLAVNPLAIFVDTQIIARAPARLFAAGIGDAVSKYFESQQCLRSEGVNSFGTRPLSSALMMAKYCYQQLIDKGERAYQDVCHHNASDAVEQVTEASILLSGIGFESGGLSLAHSLIRGLTAVPAMLHSQHGEMVAFGTMVQLFASGGHDDEIQAVAKLLMSLSLPVTLDQLSGGACLDEHTLAHIADATLAHRYSKNFTPALTSPRLVQAMKDADQFGHRFLQQHGG